MCGPVVQFLPPEARRQEWARKDGRISLPAQVVDNKGSLAVIWVILPARYFIHPFRGGYWFALGLRFKPMNGGQMLSDFGEIVLAFYFSSFIFVILPALGLAVGALTGRLTPGVSTALGSIIGLASGVLGLGLTFLASWVLLEPGGGSQPRYLLLLIAFGLPIGGVLAPVAVLQLVRRRRC